MVLDELSARTTHRTFFAALRVRRARTTYPTTPTTPIVPTTVRRYQSSERGERDLRNRSGSVLRQRKQRLAVWPVPVGVLLTPGRLPGLWRIRRPSLRTRTRGVLWPRQPVYRSIMLHTLEEAPFE